MRSLLAAIHMLGRVPLVGRVLKRLVPVADFTGIFPLSEQQLKEWVLLDTFDMLSPTYDSPQSAATVQCWFEEAKLVGIEVGHWGHLVGRAKNGMKTPNGISISLSSTSWR